MGTMAGAAVRPRCAPDVRPRCVPAVPACERFKKPLQIVVMCPDVNGLQKSFYFLVCERFPLFAMLKNRCGKKRAPIWGPSHGKIPYI
jgi:hypothetical protein